MAAVMSADLDNTDRLVLLKDDCRKQQLELVAPDVNRSAYAFSVSDPQTILYGLGAIKGVGRGAVESVIAERDGNGLFSRTRGIEVPGWAADIGADTWAQFFLKFAAAHPAITCVTPATSKPKHMLDNIGAALGELPDAAMQRRMANVIDALPRA